MAKKDDTSPAGPDRTPLTPSATPGGGDEPPTPPSSSAAAAIAPQNALEDAVEAERQLLMQANSVLRCLSEVLLYAEYPDSVTHAEAAQVVVGLIDQSVERLDLLKLRPLLAAVKRGWALEARSERLKLGLDDDNAVREPRLVYRR